MSNLQEPMAQKFLFNVEHFVPFPQSEYGGLWVVIAEHEDECFDLISNRDDGMNQQFAKMLKSLPIMRSLMMFSRVLSRSSLHET